MTVHLLKIMPGSDSFTGLGANVLGRPKWKILSEQIPRKAQQLSQRRVSNIWKDE